MALVVPPPPVQAPRRSPRISLRRRLPSPVSSRNGIPASLVRVSTALVHPSTLRMPSRHESYKSRSRVSFASPTASRHRAKSLSAAAVPVLAGTKRKRLASPSDQADLPRYKLVVAEAHSDEEEQTPRQLRYAKRQRLLVSQSGINVPTAAATEHISPPSCVCDEQENATSPVESRRSSFAGVATVPQQDTAPADPEEDAACGDPHGPVFTPLCRRPIHWRHRTADSTDPTLWKAVCQERVEHLKNVYRDVFRAVVHAEAAAVEEDQAKAVVPAPSFSAEQPSSATSAPTANDGQTRFELYTPYQYTSVDAEEEAYMEEGGYSDDGDSEDDEDEDEDEDEDMEEEVAYEQVLILDTPASPISSMPCLPRLSSIRVSSLEPHPPSARDGVLFIGRGTPADPIRLADWAAPAPPLPPRAVSPPTWTPEALYFTPDMVPQAHIAVNAMQTDFNMEAAGGIGMSWLDPALDAGSVSPSPSPDPAMFPVTMSGFDGFSGAMVAHPVFCGIPSTNAAPLSPTGCALHESFLECLRAPGCAGPGLGASSMFSNSYASLSLPLQPAPVGELTPAFAAPSSVFPNQELAQFVRSHLVPGSVTLSHALG